MRRIIGILVILVTSVWLFSDTVRHYYPKPRDGSVLRFSHFGTYQDYETWRELIVAFESAHPGIRVHQEYVVGWYGLYNRKLRQQYLSESEPDVSLVQASSFLTFAQQFAALPFLSNDLDYQALDPVAVHMYEVDGEHRGVPVTGGTLLIYYNKRSFEKARSTSGTTTSYPAADWTLSDFEATAKALTQDFDRDGELDQFGFWQPRWLYYLPFLWSFGADVLDDSGQQWLLTDTAAESSLAFYQRMRLGPDRYAPHPHEVSQMLQDVAFLTGRTAMCINGPWFMAFLNETDLRNNYGVANIPKGSNGRTTRVTWDGIVASSRLSEPVMASAMEFIKFVASENGQRILVTNPRALPARTSVRTWLLQQHPSNAMRTFVEAMEYSRPEPQTPYFAQVDRAIQQNLSSLFHNIRPASPATVLRSIQDDPVIRKLLASNN